MPKLDAAEQEAAATPQAAELFAGIGLVRLGLEGAGFDATWSNDIERYKQATHRAIPRSRRP